jgi:alpha-ketoglutarate-dependent taurine dioxygenase
MGYTIRSIGGSFAREVSGLQLWEKLDPKTISELRAVWAEHGILVFRRQSLSEDELADFCSNFGPLELTVRTDWASPVRPEVGIISNLKDGEGKAIGGLGDGELQWHSDQSYMMNPATGALLYAVEIAHEGGTTFWANLAAAYAALPEGLRRAVEGRHAIFSYSKRLAGYKEEKDRKISEEAKRKTPDVVHSLVHVHPVTGRKALYLDPTTMTGIVGMDQVSGLALIEELTAFATQRQFVYQHDWQVGDTLLWDNGFLLHRRDPFPATERRLMKRMTIVLPRDRHIVPESMLAAA